MDPKICPNCTEKNNPEFNECWKCHYPFSTGSKLILFWIKSILTKMFLFFRPVLTWLGLIFLVVLGLFCWGLVSSVILGKMTTGQYVHKLRMDFQQGIMDHWPGPILETMDRITNVESVLNGPFRKYFGNGQLESEVFYKNGKREGLAKLYYPSGQLKAEGVFKNGKLEGAVKEYDEKGSLRQ